MKAKPVFTFKISRPPPGACNVTYFYKRGKLLGSELRVNTEAAKKICKALEACLTLTELQSEVFNRQAGNAFLEVGLLTDGMFSD